MPIPSTYKQIVDSIADAIAQAINTVVTKPIYPRSEHPTSNVASIGAESRTGHPNYTVKYCTSMSNYYIDYT